MNAFSNMQIRRLRRSPLRGFTMLELIIASTLATLIAGSMIWLLISIVREQQVTMVEGRVYRRADMVQDRVTNLLRENASASNVLNFSSTHAVPGQTGQNIFFYRLYFREGQNMPNQSIYFDTNNNELMYDPDISSNGDEERVDLGFRNTSSATLDHVWFSHGMRPGGIGDNSIIMVNLEVTDNGYGKKSFRDETDELNHISCSRSFAVNIRKN